MELRACRLLVESKKSRGLAQERIDEMLNDNGVPSSLAVKNFNNSNYSMSPLTSFNDRAESSDARARGTKFRFEFDHRSASIKLKMKRNSNVAQVSMQCINRVKKY